MLKNIPVMLEGYKLLVSEAPEVKMREEDGQQVAVKDYEGVVQYVVMLLAKPRPMEGRPRGKGAEIKVTLETEPGDDVEEGLLVELINPRVSHWENELGGRVMSGLAWKATGIKLAG